MYCITHERFAYPELMDYIPKDCLWASCPPPELPEDWQNYLQEPSEEELAEMDANAEGLSDDLWEIVKYEILYGE